MQSIFEFGEAELSRSISGCQAKSFFQLKKAVDFNRLLKLIKRVSEILKEEPKFTLNKVSLISKRSKHNTTLLNELHQGMVRKIYADYKKEEASDVDFCHKRFEDFLRATQFILKLDRDTSVDFDRAPSLQQIICSLRAKGRILDNDELQFKHSVFTPTVEAINAEGNVETSGSVWEHIHGELSHNGKSYFFVDGEWYEVQIY